MRISKDTAASVARRLTVKAEENVKSLESEFISLVVEAYLDQQPKEAVEMAKKYPEHFCFTDNICVDGCGFSREYFDVGERNVISNVEHYKQANMKMTHKVAGPLLKARDKWKKAQAEYAKLKNETRIALLNLRTTTRIQSALPIAMQYLPKGGGHQYPVPVVNLAPLKAKLEKLQPKVS